MPSAAGAVWLHTGQHAFEATMRLAASLFFMPDTEGRSHAA